MREKQEADLYLIGKLVLRPGFEHKFTSKFIKKLNSQEDDRASRAKRHQDDVNPDFYRARGQVRKILIFRIGHSNFHARELSSTFFILVRSSVICWNSAYDA